MKRVLRLLSIALVASLAVPCLTLAAVNGSHHDLTVFNGAGTNEVCFFCHGIPTTVTLAEEFGNVGQLCVTRCHIGGGSGGFATGTEPIPNIPAYGDENGNAVSRSGTYDAVKTASGFAHGLDRTLLLDAATGSNTVAFTAAAQAWPYGNDPDMECTTCHNVHNNANTPFLHADLFTGGPGGESFCEACHTNRGNSWITAEQAPTGEHPVNVTLVLNTNVARTLGGRLGRYIAIDTYQSTNVYDVTTANGTALNAPGTHYITGGKTAGWNAAANGDRFSCYTCHSPHMPATTGNSNLILRKNVSTTVAARQWNPLCIGCHGQTGGAVNTEQNPGTTAWTHPVGPGAPNMVSAAGNVVTFNNSTGTFTFAVNLARIVSYRGPGSLSGNGVGIDTTTFKPRCTSCHDVHGGDNDSMCIADLDGTTNGQMAGAVCYRCHDGVGLADVADNTGSAGELANVHHRTDPSENITTSAVDADNDTLTMDPPSWAGVSATGDRFGDLTDGLQCPDCHFGVSNGTAHNW